MTGSGLANEEVVGPALLAGSGLIGAGEGCDGCAAAIGMGLVAFAAAVAVVALAVLAVAAAAALSWVWASTLANRGSVVASV
ncbi:hypothetical protein [Macromonas bipunctata]|uniref:hypothetical protein n=1 Tax=Macromonas bipunctata TaxID=183670 RepID=UPI0011AFB174|nr:hypothetical protein [Macromonas bipunctata]